MLRTRCARSEAVHAQSAPTVMPASEELEPSASAAPEAWRTAGWRWREKDDDAVADEPVRPND
jgi:hypothetical protein